MTRHTRTRTHWTRLATVALTGSLLAVGVAAAPTASAAPVGTQQRLGGRFQIPLPTRTIDPAPVSWQTESSEDLAPGVRHQRLRLTASKGASDANLLTVDLRNPRVRTDLLAAPHIAQRLPLDQLANDAGALAGINADYFNIAEAKHPVPPTDAADGPMVSDHRLLKSAVSPGQRFGPGTSEQLNNGTEVFGMGWDRRGMVTRVGFTGDLFSPKTGRQKIQSLNSFSISPDQIGVFTDRWGATSRARSVCGLPTEREAPCDTRVTELVIRRGRVVSSANTPGANQLAADETALVGRGEQAATLARLHPGDLVATRWGPVMDPNLKWGVGGAAILRAGRIPDDLDPQFAAFTGAGFSPDGHTMFLLTVDKIAGRSNGLSITELASTLRRVGACDAVSFDGGGSTAMVGRTRAEPAVHLLNHTSNSEGRIRPVPNGVGVFSR